MKKIKIIVGLFLMAFMIGFTVNSAKALEIEAPKGNALWEEFVSKYKNSEIVARLSAAGYTLDLTYTDKTLTAVVTYETNTYTFNFVYNNGIIEYVSSEDPLELEENQMWLLNCVYALSKIKNYSLMDLYDWAMSKASFSLEIDGVEFTQKEISEDLYVIDTFKLDLENGLKTFALTDEPTTDEPTVNEPEGNPAEGENKEENKDETNGETKVETKPSEKVDSVVENPKTGISNGMKIVFASLLVIGSVLYFKFRKVSKFPKS